MKKIILSILFCFATVSAFCQKPLKLDKDLKLKKSSYKKIIKKGNFDLVSSFDTVSYNPVVLYATTFKNKKIGLIDNYGNEILKNEYDDIVGIKRSNSPVPAYHDHLLLEKGNKWALATMNGTLLTGFEYSLLSYEKHTKIGEREHPIDKRWNIPVYKDSIFKAYLDEYATKHVYLNTKGEKVKFVGYDERMQAEEKRRRTLGNQKTEVQLNIKGNNYNIPTTLGEAKPYKDHLFEIKKVENKKYLKGIYDTIQKKMIVPVEYDFIQYTPKESKGNYYVVSKNKMKYFLDASGKKVDGKPYKNIYEIRGKQKSAFVVREGKRKKALFNSEFKPISDFMYDYISHSNEFILGTIDKKKVLLNYKAETNHFDVAYDRIQLKTNKYQDVVESFIFLRKEGKFAIVNKKGKLISGFDYEQIIPECYVTSGKYTLHEESNMTANHPNRFIYFKKDGKYGVMDNDYRVILNNEYDMILESNFTHFIYLGKRTDEKSRKTKWGVYNVKDRKLVLPIEFDRRIETSNSFFAVTKDKKHGLYDKKGNAFLPLEFDERISVKKLYNGLYSFAYYAKYTPFAYKDSSGNIFYVNKKE